MHASTLPGLVAIVLLSFLVGCGPSSPPEARSPAPTMAPVEVATPVGPLRLVKVEIVTTTFPTGCSQPSLSCNEPRHGGKYLITRYVPGEGADWNTVSTWHAQNGNRVKRPTVAVDDGAPTELGMVGYQQDRDLYLGAEIAVGAETTTGDDGHHRFADVKTGSYTASATVLCPPNNFRVQIGEHRNMRSGQTVQHDLEVSCP